MNIFKRYAVQEKLDMELSEYTRDYPKWESVQYHLFLWSAKWNMFVLRNLPQPFFNSEWRVVKFK